MRLNSVRSFLRGRHLPPHERKTPAHVSINNLLKDAGFDARLNPTKGWRIPRREASTALAFLKAVA